MIVGGGLNSTKDFHVLNDLMIEQYGAMAILALDGDLVVGFVSFFPTHCPHFDLCMDEQIRAAMERVDEMRNPALCADPALHVRCLMVRPEYRGNRLSIALLVSLKEWAGARGWRKIVGNGCIFSGRARYQWLVAPKPPKPIWEKAGFCAQDYAPLALKAVSDEASARRSRDWYRSDAYPGHLPRDIPTDSPDWREIFADYTMVCELP